MTPGAHTGTGNVTAAASVSADELTADVPGLLEDGDALLAVPWWRNVGGEITPPDGWLEAAAPSSIYTFGVWVKPVPSVAAEPADYTFSATVTSRCALQITRISAADLDNLVDAVGAISAFDGTEELVLPSVDAVSPGCLLIAISSANHSTLPAPVITCDARMTEVSQEDTGGGSSSAVQIAQEPLTASGATGTRTATMAPPVNNSAGFMLAIKAAPPPEPKFPDAPLKVDVELQIGETWERITGDVHTADPITIERGREDEASEVAPSKMGLTLRNPNGRYSPRNPRSPYFGLIGRNTPIRLRVEHPDLPPPAPYVYMPGSDGNYISTPDAAALDLTDVVDIRLDITPDSWRPTVGMALAGKVAEDQYSWLFLLRDDGYLRFRWTSDGVATEFASTSTEPVPDDSARRAVRVVFNGTDPAHGGFRSYTYYTAPTIDGPWTQLGAPGVGDGAGAIYAGTAPLEVGSIFEGGPFFSDIRVLHGELHGFQLADGSGQVVADPGITAADEGATEWTGPDGLTWTAHGTTRILTGGPASRFYGEVASWPPTWSLGGHQQKIPISAAGIKRRLGQGAAPVESTLRRSIPATEHVAAYWPMEDSGGGFASAFPGAPPLRPTRNGPSIDYSADAEFVASAPLPRMGAGVVAGPVPAYTITAEPSNDLLISSQVVMMLLHVPSELDGARTLARITTTGTVARWDLWYSTADGGQLAVSAYDQDGNQIDEQTTGLPVVGRRLRVGLDLHQNLPGDGVGWNVDLLEEGDPDSWQNVGFGISPGDWTIGHLRTIQVGDASGLGDTTIGHLTLYTAFTLVLNLEDEFNGYPGEPAGVRLARLAGENNVPMQIVGDLAGTARMGPQRVDTLLNLLEDCAAADGGILGEARDEAGLLYRTRASLYNQGPALELAYGEPGLAAPFEPVDDDQATVNDVTVSREGGSSARIVQETGPLSVQAPPDGVGAYDESLTVNVADDDQLSDIAGWLLHLGTWDEARYPALGVKLHKAPGLIAAAAAMDFGDRVTVADLPVWLPPEDADALIQGYVETIELLRWRIDCNATPAGPWRVAVLDDAVLDTAGAELAASVDEAGTALSVATTSGPVWTTDAAEMPIGIVVGGEEMAVTAVIGASSPQTFTVARSVNGIVKSHSAGADVRLAHPAIVAL